MKRILIGALAAATLGLSACNNDNSTAPFAGNVRLVNGIPDSGSITASATSGFTNTPGIGFDNASSTVTVPEGGYNVRLQNDNSASFFTINNVSVDHNNITTLYTNGSINASTGKGFAVEENIGAPASGQFTFQFVNATTQAATANLSVYLVTAGGGIGSATAVASVDADKASDAKGFAAGTYEVVVTSGTTPIYDSGPTGGIVLPPAGGSNVVQIGALDASATQQTSTASLITLVITDNKGGQTLHTNGKN